MRWRISKFDGKPLTPDIQNEMQIIIKKNRNIYLCSEDAARNLSAKWHSCVVHPQSPRFIETAVPVVLSGNDAYAPFMAVMLQSLLDNSNPERKYHFIFFESDFSDWTKERLTEQILNFPHCMIDFVNTKNALDDIPFALNSIRFSKDIFSRFFIPYWLNKYPKVIYCDSDMLAKADISKLYDMDMQDYCIGATSNQWLNSVLNRRNYSSLISFAIFSLLENWPRYINSGLLVFNSKKFRELYSCNDLIKFTIYYTNRYKKIFPDQDILSFLFKDNCFILPPEWNCCWTPTEKNNRYYLQTADSNINIIHFTSYRKPWKDLPEMTNNPTAQAYRDYAKNIPLFNEYFAVKH